jgi:hypothetical protein
MPPGRARRTIAVAIRSADRSSSHVTLDGDLQLLAYAVVATATPLGLAATLAVIASGRLKALLFGIGFVVAQLGSLAVLVVVGAALDPSSDRDHHGFRVGLELAFGAALLLLALAVHRRPADDGDDSSVAQVLDRLRRLRPLTALAAGVLLGVGGPKRLVLTALAAATIAASGTAGRDSVALAVGYAAIATLVVWLPIAAFVVAGDRAVGAIDAAARALAARQRAVTVVCLAVVGVLAVVHGLAQLA